MQHCTTVHNKVAMHHRNETGLAPELFFSWTWLRLHLQSSWF